MAFEQIRASRFEINRAGETPTPRARLIKLQTRFEGKTTVVGVFGQSTYLIPPSERHAYPDPAARARIRWPFDGSTSFIARLGARSFRRPVPDTLVADIAQ
jgi:hypothetical protein